MHRKVSHSFPHLSMELLAGLVQRWAQGRDEKSDARLPGNMAVPFVLFVLFLLNHGQNVAS